MVSNKSTPPRYDPDPLRGRRVRDPRMYNVTSTHRANGGVIKWTQQACDPVVSWNGIVIRERHERGISGRESCSKSCHLSRMIDQNDFRG